MTLTEFKSSYPQIFLNARKSKRLSQKKVAEKLGITLGNVCHYEKAIREPNLAMLDLWAKSVGLEITINFGPEDKFNHSVC